MVKTSGNVVGAAEKASLIRPNLEKRQNADLLLKRKQEDDLRRLEEQILKWQLDAKNWIAQLKAQQKQQNAAFLESQVNKDLNY